MTAEFVKEVRNGEVGVVGPDEVGEVVEEGGARAIAMMAGPIT